MVGSVSCIGPVPRGRAESIVRLPKPGSALPSSRDSTTAGTASIAPSPASAPEAPAPDPSAESSTRLRVQRLLVRHCSVMSTTR
jgi:hypothetical protein